jgi:hypothetical protein
MADVGKLAVQLSANPAEFTAGMQRAMEAAAQFTNQVQSKFGNLGGAVLQLNSAVGGLNIGPTLQKAAMFARQAGMVIGNAFAGDWLGAAVGAATMAVTAGIAFVGMGQDIIGSAMASMQAVAATAKLGRQLGISAEAAQALSLAANVAGMSQEDFAHGMGVFVRRMGELRSEVQGGGGQISAAMQRMGIDAQAFSQMDAGAQMVELARGLQSVGNAADRAKDLHDVLGRAGESMGPFLMRGPEFVATMQAMAVSMGAVVSNEDAARMQGVMKTFKEIAALSDMFSTGIGLQLARGLLPAFEAFANLKDHVIKDFAEMGGAGMGDSIYHMASIAADGLTKLFEILESMRPIWRSTVGFSTEWVATIWELYQAVSPLLSVWLELVSALLGGQMSIRSVTDVIDGLRSMVHDFGERIKEWAVTIRQEWIPAIADASQSLGNWLMSLSNMPGLPDSVRQSMMRFATSAAEASVNIRAIGERMDIARAASAEYGAELERLKGNVAGAEAGSVEAVSAILAAREATQVPGLGAGGFRGGSVGGGDFGGPAWDMPAPGPVGELANAPQKEDVTGAIQDQTGSLTSRLDTMIGLLSGGANVVRARLGL